MREAWFHVIFSTFGTWLRGDRRGFRDHDHRIHSSGDYKTPPPAIEHAGLRNWTIRVMHKDPVRLAPELRSRVGVALLRKLAEHEIQVLAISVSGEHVHLLGRFPHETARKIVGLAKAHASHTIRDAIPGVVFAKKCKLEPIQDREHHVNTFRYIVDHQEEGAWVWTFREQKSSA
jgi:REP element-mobilizing transposase RayT